MRATVVLVIGPFIGIWCDQSSVIRDSLSCPVAILCDEAVASVLPHLPPITVLAASIHILCDNTCAQKPSQSLLKNKSKTKENMGLFIFIPVTWRAHRKFKK